MLSELCTSYFVEVKLNDNEDCIPAYGGVKVKLVSNSGGGGAGVMALDDSMGEAAEGAADM